MPYKILTYDQIDRTAWSRLVQNSSTGTWFQTPEAYEFFASIPELFMPFVVAGVPAKVIKKIETPEIENV